MEIQPPQPGRCPMNTQFSRTHKPTIPPDNIEKVPAKPIDRRTLLRIGGLGASAAAIATVGAIAWMPKRVLPANAMSRPATNTLFSDIQFDWFNFLHPVQTIAGIPVGFGVVFTFFAPAELTRNPTKADQRTLAEALSTIEANYSFSPSGIFTLVSYGIPYFKRLPKSLVSKHIPTLAFDPTRSVLEEAVPGPTDFGPQNPHITKLQANFRVPVKIEHNDTLFTFRSDSLNNILDTMAWLQGSGKLNGRAVPSPRFNGLLRFKETRINFVQPGLPRKMADQASAAGIAPFKTIATEINPASSMWMGFVDQQVNGTAFLASNPEINSGIPVTFATNGPHATGVNSAQLTSAAPGDYFDNGAIQHLSHVLDDLEQFYTKEGPPRFPDGPEPFSERVQYMFGSQRSDGSDGLPFPEDPHDPFTNGGGLGAATGNLATQQKSAFLSDFTLGPEGIFNNYDPDVLVQKVNPHKKYRVGHELALQRSSRAPDGTPLHYRIDGPGLSKLDVPDGSQQPTLEFSIFVPSSEFFRAMRVNAASLDMVKSGQNGGTGTSVPAGIEASDAGDDGLERFLSATRRQNFLVPPRRNRAFPLVELT